MLVGTLFKQRKVSVVQQEYFASSVLLSFMALSNGRGNVAEKMANRPKGRLWYQDCVYDI